MKKIISLMLALGTVGLANAGESVGSAKTTATIQSTCSIEANPIGFGVVSTPLMMQQSQSEMNIKCSNASAYTVDLAYGGIYGEGTSNSEYKLRYNWSNSSASQFDIYNNLGVKTGWISCGFGSQYGSVYLGNPIAGTLYGYTTTNTWVQDTKGVCTSDSTKSGTYPKGWVGSYSDTSGQPVGGPAYNYGVMIGASKGHTLAYSINLPGDSNKIWNNGNNSYNSTGNGDFQSIILVAKIIPENSGKPYPAPDIYLDTITAIISY